MAALLVNDQVAKRLLENEQLKAQIPCLASQKMVVKKAKPCRCKGRKKTTVEVLPTDGVKRCLLKLPDEQLALVKQALGTDRLIFYFNTPGLPPRSVR